MSPIIHTRRTIAVLLSRDYPPREDVYIVRSAIKKWGPRAALKWAAREGYAISVSIAAHAMIASMH